MWPFTDHKDIFSSFYKCYLLNSSKIGPLQYNYQYMSTSQSDWPIWQHVTMVGFVRFLFEGIFVIMHIFLVFWISILAKGGITSVGTQLVWVSFLMSESSSSIICHLFFCSVFQNPCSLFQLTSFSRGWMSAIGCICLIIALCFLQYDIRKPCLDKKCVGNIF